MARIALYYPWIYLQGGAERLIYEMVRESRHEWTIFTSHYAADRTFPEMAELDIVPLEEVSIERSLGPLVRAAYTIRKQRLPLGDYDALVVVCEGFGDLITFGNQETPTLCVCLTPLKIIHDRAANKRMHASQSLGKRAAFALLAPFYRMVERRAWRNYDGVIAISHEVKKRLLEAHLAPSESIEVAYPGAALPDERPTRDAGFFLIAGRIMWEKDIELGIESFLRAQEGLAPESSASLVIAGFVDDKSQEYAAWLRERIADEPSISMVESPPHDELETLYAECRSLIFTAPNEEFGLVVVEAMSYGKPVISVDRGGPSEIVRDGVDGLLTPGDSREMSKAIRSLTLDPELAAKLGTAAYDRAREFTWTRFAGAVDEGVEQVAPNAGTSVSKEEGCVR